MILPIVLLNSARQPTITVFIEVISGLLSMREITKRAAPTNRLEA